MADTDGWRAASSGSGEPGAGSGEAPAECASEQPRAGGTLRSRLRRRAQGRRWRWPRLLLLLVLAWLLKQHLTEPGHAGLFSGINLVVHEAGHLALGWFGELPGILGGTLFELGAPLAATVAFFRREDDFAVAVAVFWLGTALVDVGFYAADARLRSLPLVSPGTGEPVHDWAWLLGRLRLLEHDRLLGALLRWSGLLSMAGSLVLGAAVVREIGHEGPPPGRRNNARGDIY